MLPWRCSWRHDLDSSLAKNTMRCSWRHGFNGQHHRKPHENPIAGDTLGIARGGDNGVSTVRSTGAVGVAAGAKGVAARRALCRTTSGVVDSLGLDCMDWWTWTWIDAQLKKTKSSLQNRGLSLTELSMRCRHEVKKRKTIIVQPREIMFHPARVNPRYCHYHCILNGICKQRCPISLCLPGTYSILFHRLHRWGQGNAARPRAIASHRHSGTVAHGPQLVGRDCDDDLSVWLSQNWRHWSLDTWCH